MKLHEKNLKEIIKHIEKYGVIKEIKIKNSAMSISLPTPKSKQPAPSQLKELDLNRPKEFEISFVMGDEKSEL